MFSSPTAPTFIDLFCGCGGFTLGMLRAGFECLAAIDVHEPAVEALRKNLTAPKASGLRPVRHALRKDLTQFPPHDLAQLIGTERLDVIVGGPPCQGFSTARQVDGANHGHRLKEDARRHLYRHFLEYVEYFQPKVFIIENVLGLRTAAGGRYFTAVQHESRILGIEKGHPGYRVHGQVEKAEELGVPQKRRRQLIIGVRADLVGYFPAELTPPPRCKLGTMLGDAIGDLPLLKAGEGACFMEYDITRRDRQHLNGERHYLRASFLRNIAEVQFSDGIYNHEARPHSARDLRDFARIPEGGTSAELMRRNVRFEFPYRRDSFKDRFTRQHRNRPCSTIVAHLSKDGLMFIHPVQNRSISPREAARVQTFPDWFIFPEARTHSFRMIGNAVPPVIGESAGRAIVEFLASAAHPSPQRSRSTIPSTVGQAKDALETLMQLPVRELRKMPTHEFMRGWHALLWLFPHLHPNNALDHGRETMEWTTTRTGMATLPPMFQRFFPRSGWPCSLVCIGEEAWRRFEQHEIAFADFYCEDAQRARLMLLPS